jgi:Secretion system C-terminal sorting domain/Domain of unknown function DUF11
MDTKTTCCFSFSQFLLSSTRQEMLHTTRFSTVRKGFMLLCYQFMALVAIAQNNNSLLKITNVAGVTTAKAGQTIRLDVTLKNEGTTPSLPDSVYIGQIQQGYQYSYIHSTANRVAIPAVAAGATKVFSVDFTIKDPFLAGATITFNSYVAQRSATFVGLVSKAVQNSAFASVQAVDGFAYPIVPISPVVKLDMKLTTNNSVYTPGTTPKFTITITNTGTETAKGIAINYPCTEPTKCLSLVVSKGTTDYYFVYDSRVTPPFPTPRYWVIPELKPGETATAEASLIYPFLGIKDNPDYFFTNDVFTATLSIESVVFNNIGTKTASLTFTKASTNNNSTCKTYNVINTNDVCGCPENRWKPYVMFLNSPNVCPGAVHQADNDLRLEVQNNGTATLKGTVRTATWQPIAVNIAFGGGTSTPPLGRPFLDLCNKGKAISVATGWQYFTTMTGTIKIGNDAPLTVSRRPEEAIQLGMGANNQMSDKMGLTALFQLSNGQKGDFRFVVNNEQTIACGTTTPPNPTPTPTPTGNVTLTMTAEPTTYAQWGYNKITVTVENKTGADIPNAKVVVYSDVYADMSVASEPTRQAVASIGSSKDLGSVWKMGTFPANSKHTWTFYSFAKVGGKPLLIYADFYKDKVATQKIASITLAPANLAPRSAAAPLFIQKIHPNPISTDDILLEVESFDQRMGEFNLLDITGKVVSTQNHRLQQGNNQIQLDISALAEGMYFVMPKGGVASKFIRVRE